MRIQLRAYQLAAVDAVFSYFESATGNPLVVLPTGTGKSVVLAALTQRAISAWPETRILIVTHQRELISQNFQALLRAWPEAPAGIYSAGLSRRDIHAQILFAGIQSIHRHAYKVQRCDLVLIDEAHLLGRSDSGMYRSFLAQLNEINAGLLKVVGFTATPYRLDSGLLHEGKDRLFTDIAYEVPVLDMIQQGYLCPVVPKQTETQLDVAGVGTRGGSSSPRTSRRQWTATRLRAPPSPRSCSTARAADRGWCSAPGSRMRGTCGTRSASTASPARPSPATRQRRSVTASSRPSRPGGCAASPTPTC